MILNNFIFHFIGTLNNSFDSKETKKFNLTHWKKSCVCTRDNSAKTNSIRDIKAQLSCIFLFIESAFYFNYPYKECIVNVQLKRIFETE